MRMSPMNPVRGIALTPVNISRSALRRSLPILPPCGWPRYALFDPPRRRYRVQQRRQHLPVTSDQVRHAVRKRRPAELEQRRLAAVGRIQLVVLPALRRFAIADEMKKESMMDLGFADICSISADLAEEPHDAQILEPRLLARLAQYRGFGHFAIEHRSRRHLQSR